MWTDLAKIWQAFSSSHCKCIRKSWCSYLK